MARMFIFLNIFFILCTTTTSLATHSSKPKPKPPTFVFPVFKETKYGLYYTSVTVGEPPLKVNLGIDLTGSALWFHCSEVGYKSTTSTPILCGSDKCKQTSGGRCTTCDDRYGPFCRNDTCSANLYFTSNTGLFEDNVILSYTSSGPALTQTITANVSHRSPKDRLYTSPSRKLATRLPLVCIPNTLSVGGSPYGSQGLMGLGSNSISFVNRLVSSYKIPLKVALCLPSKPKISDFGRVYIGGIPNRKDVLELLVSTPLVMQKDREMGDTYFIDVKSIEVNGETLSFNQNLLFKGGNTMIRTVTPYTVLESPIYKALVKAFAGNAKRQKAVYPFDDCFSSEIFARKKTPVISLVFGGGVKWKIYGENSLVKVNKNVVCLAFLEGITGSVLPVEIGGYQMEDHLVEFDLQALKFSFTSSLLLHNTSCSRQ